MNYGVRKTMRQKLMKKAAYAPRNEGIIISLNEVLPFINV